MQIFFYFSEQFHSLGKSIGSMQRENLKENTDRVQVVAKRQPVLLCLLLEKVLPI